MRKDRVIHLCQACRCPAMFWMTVTTTQGGIIMHHPAMQRRDALHLGRNRLMSNRTAIRHRRRFPGRNVAGFAVAAGLGM